jgi:hypothetical protein
MKSNGRVFAALVVVLLLLIGGFLVWKSRQPEPVANAVVAPNPSPATNAAVAAPAPRPQYPADFEAQNYDPHKPAHVPPWLAKLDEIVTSDNPSDENKVEQMAALMPGLPMEGKLEYARQMTVMLDDTNYTPVKKILLDPTTPTNVFNLIFNEFVTRGNALKLPVYVDMLKIPNHSYHERARQVLLAYLRMDYGDDPAKWEAAVQEYLKMTGAIP